MARRRETAAPADRSGVSPFYERRVFQGTAAVVGLLAGIWGLLGPPPPWRLIGDLFEAEIARSNTEIVLDTSAAMAKRFANGETKLAAAVRALQSGGQRNDEGLGLRLTNPDCKSEEDPLIGVGTHHVEKVLSTAESLKPNGRSNITQAVKDALAEFRANPDFHRRDSVRRVLVYTSGHDDCFGHDFGEKIEADLKLTHGAASFTLIALKPTEADRRRLAGIEAALESAGAAVETIPAENPGELEEASERAEQETEQALEEAEEERKEGEGMSG